MTIIKLLLLPINATSQWIKIPKWRCFAAICDLSINLPGMSSSQSRSFNHREGFRVLSGQKCLSHLKMGWNAWEEFFWQMWAPQKGQSSYNLSPAFCPPGSALFVAAPLFAPPSPRWRHNTNGPILLDHKPEGFYKLRQTVGTQTRRNRMATGWTAMRCKKSRSTKTRGVVDSKCCSFWITSPEKKPI